MNKIKEIRKVLGITQSEMSEIYGIPKRTIEDWEAGRREPADYLVELLKNSAERVASMKKKIEALQKSKDVEKIVLVREGYGYTLYIDDLPCGWGDVEDHLEALNDWLEKGRTLQEYAEECQACR